LQKSRFFLKREDIYEKLKQTKQGLDDLEEIMKNPYLLNPGINRIFPGRLPLA
jgi:hypothetical protein